MVKYEIQVEGTKAMLQNKYCIEDGIANIKESKKVQFDGFKQASKKIYKTSEGKCFIPSEHFLAAIVSGGKGRKITGDKTVLSYHLKRILCIYPEQILLYGKDNQIKETWDEIDVRRTVNPNTGGANPTARPMFHSGWKATFVAELIEDEVIPKDIFLSIVQKSGTYGIGDYRPRFGGFIVTSFKEI